MTQSKSQKTKLWKFSLYAQRALVYLVLGILTLIIFMIFYILIVSASRQSSQIQQGFSLIFGSNFSHNFKNLQDATSIYALRSMWNSFWVASISATLTTYFSALTAYGIHLYRFKGRKFLYGFILAIMMIPTQVASAGLLALIWKVGLNDSYMVLIVPGIAAPATFFFLKQYFDSTLPYEVIESARVDGANELRIFHQLALPMVSPALAVQFIFGFVASYNNFYLPSLVLESATKRTVPLALAMLSGSAADTFDLGMVYMFIMLAIIPMLIVYLIVSQKIIKGVTLGSVKG